MTTGPRRTILIVDDEFSSVEVLTLLLEREGLGVLSASDGLEAMERISTVKPDLVITDYMMPRMNGLQVCEKLREKPETSRVPVILVSGSFIGTLDGTQVVAFMRKPFLFDRLLTKIRSVLADR